METNREVTHPKVTFRVPRERLRALRIHCASEGISLSGLFNLIADGVLNGRIVVDARNVQPWEQSK